jgi:hypothetical protein
LIIRARSSAGNSKWITGFIFLFILAIILQNSRAGEGAGETQSKKGLRSVGWRIIIKEESAETFEQILNHIADEVPNARQPVCHN